MISFNGQNIINDRIILEKNEAKITGSNIIIFDIYQENLNKLQKSIRRIAIDKKIYGTGFLMELEKENTPFYCLITNEHVISEDLIEENTKIELVYDQNSREELKPKEITLNKDERFIRNYK